MAAGHVRVMASVGVGVEVVEYVVGRACMMAGGPCTNYFTSDELSVASLVRLGLACDCR